MARYVLHSDGAARGNPGPASLGVVIYDETGAEVVIFSHPLGDLTNNQAEYRALVMALRLSGRLSEVGLLPATDIQIRLDSELIVKQIQGHYKVKNEGLRPFYKECMAELAKFPKWSIGHVRREQNRRADELANAALDGRDPYTRAQREMLKKLGLAA